MKLNIKIILLVLITFMSGCSLEETIYDTNTSDNFIKNEESVTTLMYGIYSDMTSYGYYKNSWQYINLFAGNDVSSLSSSLRSYGTRTVSTTKSDIGYIYTLCYRVLGSVNTLMTALEETDAVSDEYKKRIMGELHFLRAMNYFNLVRIYGGVPVQREQITGASELYPSRNTVEEVYELIFEDFNIAVEDCILFSEQPADEKGHANKGAAQAMLALAYLTYGNNLDLNGEGGSAEYYKLAKSLADAVIMSGEYRLVNDFASLWDVNQETNSYNEVIFGMQFTRDAATANAGSKGSSFAYYRNASERYDVTGYTNGRGSSYVRVQPWFYDMYNTGEYENDYRTETSFVTRFRYQYSDREVVCYPEIATEEDDVTRQYPYLNKYVDPNGLQARNNENDYFIMRLAEVYLIKAEAENELNGPTAVAYDAFNMLRARARMANGEARDTPADLEQGLTKEEFRLKVFNERGLELVAEGHRNFDMIRMRYTDNTRTMIQYYCEDFYPSLGSTSPPSFNKETLTWEGGRVVQSSIVPWTKRFLLWPVPTGEINSNPNLTQNTEYEW